VLLARRDVFQQDPVLDALAVAKGIDDVEGAEEPGAPPVSSELPLVLDVVAVVAALLVLDVDVEDVFDGVAPVVEGSFGRSLPPLRSPSTHSSFSSLKEILWWRRMVSSTHTYFLISPGPLSLSLSAIFILFFCKSTKKVRHSVAEVREK